MKTICKNKPLELYQNIETFFLVIIQIGMKKKFVIKKVNNIMTWTLQWKTPMKKIVLRTFSEKNLKKQIKQSLELKK